MHRKRERTRCHPWMAQIKSTTYKCTYICMYFPSKIGLVRKIIVCPKGHPWIHIGVPSGPNMESEQG